MGDHVVLSVDRLMTLSTTEPEKPKDLEPTEASGVNISTSRQQLSDSSDSAEVSISSKEDGREPLIQVIECRICQEEDHIKNLETPCACNGSLKVSFKYPLSDFFFMSIYYKLCLCSSIYIFFPNLLTKQHLFASSMLIENACSAGAMRKEM